MPPNLHRKETFNLIPALYDEIRPGYPLEVLQSIETFAQLLPESKILEVGSGTGQAGGYFIGRGYQYIGVDLGGNMVEFSDRKYANNHNARFVQSSFEAFECSPSSFDLLLAAQSLHWIEPGTALKKSATFLKKSGAIAIVWNLDESQDTDFYRRSTPLHERFLPGPPGGKEKQLQDWCEEYYQALETHEAYTGVERKELSWQKSYSADEWIKLRETFSPDLCLSITERQAFHTELKLVINELGGAVPRLYRTVCLLARRV